MAELTHRVVRLRPLATEKSRPNGSPRLGPSSALSHPLFWLGGFPYENRLQKKGTTILTSLLEDLVEPNCAMLNPDRDSPRQKNIRPSMCTGGLISIPCRAQVWRMGNFAQLVVKVVSLLVVSLIVIPVKGPFDQRSGGRNG